MKVLKFGGTSVGTADRMNEVIDIIEKNSFDQIIVLSAMSGTTNDLVEIAQSINQGRTAKATQEIDQLELKYVRVLTDLYPDKADRDRARRLLKPSFQLLKDKNEPHQILDVSDTNEILAQGELISSQLFALICEIRGVNVALIPALDFMRTNQKGEPDMELSQELVRPYVQLLDEDLHILVTQGYICRDIHGDINNLQRGGSDYTATILGAITAAEEVQIWTDIDGVHNNDPRLVDNTDPIRKMSYREAAELAYFGAKILHPTCVLPAEKSNVPLRLKCTMDPLAQGTLISSESSDRPITALAAKGDITAIKIYSHRMLNAYGFLKRVFQVFENHQTSVDMITTSEVAVSLTIDDTQALSEIIADLSQFSEVDIDDGYAIICIVGNALYDGSAHVKRVFQFLENIPLRMVSMGGSRYNISVLVKAEFKKPALIALNQLFVTEPVVEEVFS